MRLDGAAGATGQVYEPDGILGFISVINGPSLSVLWKERGVLASGSIGFAFRKRNASITFESRALTLVFVVCDANRPIRAGGGSRPVLRQLTLPEGDRMLRIRF